MFSSTRLRRSSCCILLSLGWLVLASGALAQPAPCALDDLLISVTTDHPREFIYTDKGAAHIAGEAVGENTRSYHGFYIAMHEVVDGWSLRLADGTEVGAGTAFAADVYPDRLVRYHHLPGDVTPDRDRAALRQRERLPRDLRRRAPGVPSR